MADVQVHPGEGHLEDHAPAVGGAGHGVEQAVGQPRVLHDASLVLAQAVVALGSGEPAPDHGGEQVAGYLFARQALHVVGLSGAWQTYYPSFAILLCFVWV